MRAKLEKLSDRVNQQSFLCYEVKVPSFEFLWHYHPEYELTYIIKGSGKRLVGDSYENFVAGDLVLLGPNMPHTWISEKNKRQSCSAIVIQFSNDFIEPLLQYQEMSNIKKLLTKSEKGLYFAQGNKKDSGKLMQDIIHHKGMNAFTSILQLLQKLSTAKSAPLASVHFKPMKGSANQHRINKVFQYVQKEFNQEITLQKAASLIHISQSGFCKFFKTASGKTFSDYVNDIRIAKVCELLIETDKPVSAIAFESGFESLSYFNRVFFKKKGVKPSEIRKHK